MSNQPFVSDYIQGQRYMIARIAAKTKEAQEKEEKAQEAIVNQATNIVNQSKEIVNQ